MTSSTLQHDNKSSQVVLDHLAIAVRNESEILKHLVGEYGGTILYGGSSAGFRWVLLWLGGAEEGMFIEVLVPWLTEEDDFLERFLLSRGDGPHHVTFRVSDLQEMVTLLRESEYDPVKTNVSDSRWKETYIHPREAHGVLIQIVETTIRRPPIRKMLEIAKKTGGSEELTKLAGGFGAGEVWWPLFSWQSNGEVIARRLVMATQNIGSALKLFGGLLDGRTVGQVSNRIELSWSGGTIVLDPASRPSGIQSLECTGRTHGTETVGGLEFKFSGNASREERAEH